MVPNAGNRQVPAMRFVTVVKTEKNTKKLQKGVDKTGAL